MVLNLIKINQRTREVLILRDKLLLRLAPTLQSETKEMETKHQAYKVPMSTDSYGDRVNT